MQRTPSLVPLLAAVVSLTTFTFAARAEEKKGLYADEGKDKTTGDLKDQDYWWAKWDAKMLEHAIKTRQPEGPISINVAVALRRLEPLVKKYPKHEDLKKCQGRFEENQKKQEA